MGARRNNRRDSAVGRFPASGRYPVAARNGVTAFLNAMPGPALASFRRIGGRPSRTYFGATHRLFLTNSARSRTGLILEPRA